MAIKAAHLTNKVSFTAGSHSRSVSKARGGGGRPKEKSVDFLNFKFIIYLGRICVACQFSFRSSVPSTFADKRSYQYQ